MNPKISASLLALTLALVGSTPARAQGAQQALGSWQTQYGIHWDIVFNEITGEARMLLGGQAFMYLPTNEVEEFQLARDFIDAAFGMFEVETSSLVNDRIITLPLTAFGTTDKRTVRFQQESGGVPIVGRTVNVLFESGTGKLLSIDSTAISNLPLVVSYPIVAGGDAQLLAGLEFEAVTGAVPDEISTPELVILPLDDEGQPPELVLSWQVDAVRVDQGDEDASYRYYIDAGASGSVVLAIDRVQDAATQGQVSPPKGKVRALVTENGTCCVSSNCCWLDDTGTNRTFAFQPYMTVTSGSGQTSTTNSSGIFTTPLGSSSPAMTLTFDGPFVAVDNLAGPNTSVSATLAGSLTQITMNPVATEQNVAEANAFYRVNQTRDWVRGVNPNDATADSSSSTANVPYQLLVNAPEVIPFQSACNAKYLGSAVKFWASAPGRCGNSAFATLIWHEMGHWLNDRYGNPFYDTRAAKSFHEGSADVFSMYQMDYEQLFYNGVALRSGMNAQPSCGDCEHLMGCVADPHLGGLPLMGAFWKMRFNLKAANPSTGGALANALFLGWHNAFDQNRIHSIIEFQLLLLDDNDGNLANGTPHAASINPAFVYHGFHGYVPSEFSLAQSLTVKICP
jgi:hypothetical protein